MICVHHRTRNLRSVFFGAGALAALAVASSAAQADSIETVTVTAERTEQRLIDVGAAVSAFSPTQVKAQRIEEVKDIFPLIPNADMKQNFPGMMPVLTIRGVGLDDVSSTSNPGVGVYVDEVPLATLTLMNGDYYDVARIEVLKGPQGTLYGRNTTGGAVNIISAKPTDKFEAYLSGGYGNYDTFTAEGMVNIPVADDLNIRMSAKTIQQQEGYYRSDREPAPLSPVLLGPVGPGPGLGSPCPSGSGPSFGGDFCYPFAGRPGSRSMGKRDLVMGRIQADWHPTEDLDVLFKLEGEHGHSETAPLKGQPQLAGTGLIGPFVDTNPDPYHGNWDADTPLNLDTYNATLKTTYDMGWANLTSVTGLIHMTRFFNIEGDGTGFAVFSIHQADHINQVTQEFRLDGKSDLADWIVGAFGSFDHVRLNNHTDLYQFLPLLTATNMPGLPIPLFNGETAGQDTYSAAVFANATWHLLPDLDLVTGGRFSWEERKFNASEFWGGTNPFGIPVPIEALLGLPPGGFGLCAAGTQYITNSGFVAPVPLGPPAFGCPATPSTDPNVPPTPVPGAIVNPSGILYTRATNFSHRIAFNWRVAEDALVYLSEAMSTKSGGFFSETTTDSHQFLPYKPERLQAIELGGKIQRDWYALNAAVFFYNYHNMQVEATSPQGIGGQTVVNVPSATIQGFEMDGTLLPFDGMTLQAGMGWLHSRLGEFRNITACPAPPLPCNPIIPAGNEPANAPKFTATALARYQFPVMTNWDAAIQGSLRYQSHAWRSANDSFFIDTPAYTDFDARVSMFDEDGLWEFALWGKNLGNETHRVNAQEARTLFIFPVSYSDPRTFGFEVTRNFD